MTNFHRGFYRGLATFNIVFVLALSFGASAEVAEKSEATKKPTLFPLVFYTPETSLAVGVIWISNLWPVREGKNSYLQSVITTTAKQQWIANITPRLYFNGGDQEVTGAVGYSYFPNQYYGNQSVHLNTPEKDTENNLSLAVSGSQRLVRDLFVRAFAQLKDLKILKTAEGGVLDQQLTQNGFRNLRATSLGLGLDWDSRNFPQSPTEGLWVRLQSQKTWVEDQDVTRSNYFYAADLDVRSYYQLQNQWILANQVFVGTLTDSEIPFQFLYLIGGNSSMRGYYQGQYRDRNLVMNQNEVRGLWNDKFGWSAFASVAKLGDGARAISESMTHLAGGGGVNYLLDPSNRIKLKIDMGISRENSGVYFVLGESF